MKNGKKPTMRQKKLMKQWRMDPCMWLVTKDTPEAMHLVHRLSGKTTKVIVKRRDEDD